MRKYAIILAGGEGLRAGGEIPKQFHILSGLPLYLWSLKAFHDYDPAIDILLVMNPGCWDILDDVVRRIPEASDIQYTEVCGGRSRWESVKNGLMAIPSGEEALIAIHDAARPLVTVDLISEGFEKAREKGSAVPVVPVTDSLRELMPDGDSKAVDRSRFVSVQTPQIFRHDILEKAYARPYSPLYTDDASVVESDGGKIALYEGNPDNIKVTYPEDFEIAEVLMKRRK